MLWTIFEVSVNLFQSLLILYFIKSRIHIVKSHPWADALCVSCCTLYLSIQLFIDLQIDDSVIMIIPLLYAIFVSEDRWYICVFWVVMLLVIFTSTVGMTSQIIMSLFEARMNELMQPNFLRLCFVIATNLVLFGVIYAASKLKRDHLYLSWTAFLSFLMIAISILIAEETLYHLQQLSIGSSATYNVGYASLLACSVFSILLFHFMTESSEREYEYKSEMLMSAATAQHQQEFSRMYNDFVSRQHDFKHQLETLEGLIRENNNQVASDYLTSYKSQLSDARPFMTGSEAVDALLTAKLFTMKEHDIVFKFTPYPLNELPLSTPDFCSIVGNLLDNSIEGCLRVADRTDPQTISLTFARTYDTFHVFCENPCDSKTLHHRKDTWRTSKRDNAGIHGLGIPSIKRIVNKADGYCAFFEQDGVFYAEMTIPYPIQYQNSSFVNR